MHTVYDGLPTSETNDTNFQHLVRQVQEREDKPVYSHNLGREWRLLEGISVTYDARDSRSARIAHDQGLLPDRALSSCTTTTFPLAHHDLLRCISGSRDRPDREHVVSVRFIEASHCPRDMRHGVRE